MSLVAELHLFDHDGSLLAIIDRWAGLDYDLTVNAPATFALQLVADDPRAALFAEDDVLEVWLADVDAGIAWYKDAEGFVGDIRRETDDDGAALLTISGKGFTGLLDKLIVAAYASTTASAKAGPAETVIKEFVEEQVGPTAGARAMPGFTVEADGATGSAVELQRSYRSVLAVCQALAKTGGGDFDVVRNGVSGGYVATEFRWYLGQRGTDRRATVTFSEDYGNMARPVLDERNSELVSVVLVGGQGEDENRDWVWVTDAALLARTPWARHELFVDAREIEKGNLQALADKGAEALAENRRGRVLAFDVVQIPGWRFGRDYWLGDLVTARYAGQTWDKKIAAVHRSFPGEGGWTVGVDMEDVV